jgi:hypothetical protein
LLNNNAPCVDDDDDDDEVAKPETEKEWISIFDDEAKPETEKAWIPIFDDEVAKPETETEWISFSTGTASSYNRDILLFTVHSLGRLLDPIRRFVACYHPPDPDARGWFDVYHGKDE